MGNNLSNTKNTKILLVGGVLLLSVVSASWKLSQKALSSHECFVSITAREMLESGDWVLPTCNGKLRLQKTPLSYWLVAGLAKITGRVDEFTARLPSAIFAFLSVVAILYFVNRWLSFRTAALCAGVWATSLGYFRNSHIARPDMALTFFVVLCFLTFYSAVNNRNRRQQVVYMLLFWISLGLGMLAKGPAPLPYVLLPLFFYVAINRKWKVLSRLLPITGTIIFLAITLPWPLFIAHRMNWDLVLWKHEFVDRFFGRYAPGHYPPFYYLFMMFRYVAPWVAFLPMALAAPFYRVWNKKRPVMQFLWLWFVVGIVFLTINQGKRQHYILPLMPAMCMLIGILLEDMIFVRKAFEREFVVNVVKGYIIVLTVAAIGAVICAGIVRPELLVGAIILGTATIVIVAVVGLLFFRNKPSLCCAAIFTGIIVWAIVGRACFPRLLDLNAPSRDFAKRATVVVPQSGKLVAYKHISPRFVHYFGRVVPEKADKSALYKCYEQGDWVICTSGYLKDLAQDGRFREVFYQKKLKNQKKEDVGGALFHKAAPVVRGDDDS